MVERLSITISDYVFDAYLSAIKGNRSEYIEKLIIIGAEAEITDDQTTKSKLLVALQKIRTLEDENAQLKGKLKKCESLIKKNPFENDPEMIKNQKFMDGMMAAGVLRDIQ